MVKNGHFGNKSEVTFFIHFNPRYFNIEDFGVNILNLLKILKNELRSYYILKLQFSLMPKENKLYLLK